MSDTRRRQISRGDRRREDCGPSSGRERRGAEIPPVVVRCDIEPEGLVVTLVNPLVVGNCFPVRDRLAKYARKFTARRIFVDLAGVPYADTAGLGILVEMRGVCLRLGKDLIVRNPTSCVREILEILQFDRKLLAERGRR